MMELFQALMIKVFKALMKKLFEALTMELFPVLMTELFKTSMIQLFQDLKDRIVSRPKWYNYFQDINMYMNMDFEKIKFNK